MKRKILCWIVSVLLIVTYSMNAWALPSYDDVLIVVNDKSPASLEIGEYFKTVRKIPDINVCHVSVTDQQTAKLNEVGRASEVEKKSILDAVKKHLTDNNLADKINYIVMTRGIPVYAGSTEWGAAATFHLTDVYLMFNLSESAADNSIPDMFSYNKYFYYYNADILNKKFSRNKFGYYIVSRLDGVGVSNIKAMIDNTGAPAYESYKKNGGKVKFLTLHQKSPTIFENELKLRTNIEVARPPVNGSMVLTATMDTVAKDVMFAYFNNVNFAYGTFPADNNFYGDGDMVVQYPFIYRGATFLPGSFATCFRSHPIRTTNRDCGGLLKLDIKTKVMTDFQKSYDGTDMKFRHMTCVTYDPVNKQIWCGTGEPPLHASMLSFDNRGTDEFFREHMRNEGCGIAIMDSATGNIIKHINANDPGSQLKNNRVVKMVFDAASKRIWVAHYKGIQYYDLTAQTFNDIPALQNDFAAACDIYLDPFDSNKVYFSFYYSDNGNYKKGSSQIAAAATDVFEYSKSTGTVTRYTIDTDVALTGVAPLMVKTAANTLWVAKGRYYYDKSTKKVTRQVALIKYDLASKTAVEKIMLGGLVPEIKTPPADLSSIYIDSPRILTVSNGKLLVTVSCGITYTANRTSGSTTYIAERKNYLIRVTEKSGVASEVEVLENTLMNLQYPSYPYYSAQTLIADPKDSNILYMGLSWPSTTLFGLLQSTDGGTTWSKLSTSARLINVYDLAFGDNGTLYAVRGYQAAQNLLYDFQAFGLTAFGGGMVHENMYYNTTRTSEAQSGFFRDGHSKGNEIYSASKESTDNYDGVNYSQTEPMMFLSLDGFSMAEVRFGTLSQYPAIGNGGYNGHMLVFEPKCAPFAPRVDEENLNPMIANKTTIEIPLKSPGLPLAMDGFIAGTINSSTVSVKDELGQPVTPSKLEYDAFRRKIVLTGDFSGTAYQVTLKCGIDGIKNIKGASLVNTRADEFKDEITYIFGISTEIYTPPIDVTGPVKMPASNSKYDLIVSKIWWTTVPVVGQPLTVNFGISNIGTAKTTAGSGIQKAKVYLNNVLVDVKSYNDIAAKGKVSLTATVPGASVTGNKQNKVMVWADATNKVAEIRETNNTNSASFMIETRPDLIVKEITLSPKPKAKAPLTIYFKINNIGASATTAGAGVQIATVFVDGKAAGSVAYDDVPKGGSITKQLVLPSGIATAVTHKIKVYVDTNKIVDEINESNNYLEKKFSIAK